MFPLRALVWSFMLALSPMAWASPALPEPDASEPRQVVAFDAGWQFHQGDPEKAAGAEFDTSHWERVDTPHDWSIAGPFRKDAPASGEGAFLPTGVAWYRKAIVAPETLRSRRTLIEFDGVMANSRVYLNGQLLGKRPNGYVSFQYDLTPHLLYGDAGPNVLAVRIDTAEQVASRWYTGSGIYRHVRLVTVDPLHFAYNGIYVTTPKVTTDEAVVAVAATISNEGSPSQFELKCEVLNHHGEVVGTANAAAEVGGGEETEVRLECAIASPRLWGFGNPSLYTARMSLVSDGQTVDQTAVPFGVRTAEFRADTGFWLNDENVKLRGVCLHHAAGAVGAAVPTAVWRDRLQSLKDLGVNAIRTAHNPVAPEFLDLCDQMGFVVMDEFFDCWTGAKRKHDYSKYFSEWWRRDLTDTIRRDRNHPSIVLYSVGNEIRDTHHTEHAKKTLAALVKACHETDPTRPVTQGLFRPNTTNDYDNGLADLLDVIGTNYRDAELLQAWRDNPNRKIVGTEQPHDRKNWLLCRDNPQHSGQFLWVGIDYLGESRRWPATTFDSGLLDRTGIPHPRGAERQSWWNDRPVVSLYRREAKTEDTPADPGYEVVEWRRRQVLFADWTPRDQTPHEENVEVYSNCDEVELVLNGRSLGAKRLPEDARSRNWRVPYEAGQLVAIGRNDGNPQDEAVTSTLTTAGPPAAIQLTSSTERLSATWEDVAMVRATVIDAAGVRCPRAADQLYFKVNGPGSIVGVDNGSIIDTSTFQSDRRRAHRGRCLAIIRANDAERDLQVTATAEGLATGSIQIATGSASSEHQP